MRPEKKGTLKSLAKTEASGISFELEDWHNVVKAEFEPVVCCDKYCIGGSYLSKLLASEGSSEPGGPNRAITCNFYMTDVFLSIPP